jgi:predicted N-acetyltransferase YhbS
LLTPQAKYYERFGFKTKATMAADLNGVPTEWWAMNIDD